jgi:GH43 family beta-xylosidase
MGVASSADLYHWKHEHVFTVDTCPTSPESPYVLKRNGQYYMFYTNTGNPLQPCACYLISDNPVNGWRVPEDTLIKENATAAEVFEFKGKWYMSYINREINEIYLLCFCEFIWDKDGHFHLGERVNTNLNKKDK